MLVIEVSKLTFRDGLMFVVCAVHMSISDILKKVATIYAVTDPIGFKFGPCDYWKAFCGKYN